LIELLSVDDPSNPEFFYKTLGSKKLSAIFRQKFNIIINHKKIHRLRKELNLVRYYHRHPKHPRKRPKNHDINRPNQYWESDIKFIPTKYDGYIPILSIIDAFDRSIVGVYIGNSIKAKDFISTLRKSIEFRGATPDTLIIRTDNGPQFKAKITAAFMEELNIIHEFGYKNNPNSQAYIESFHSSVQREFVESIEFDYIDDVYNYYISYIYFYNNLRPHGSLNYFTPDFVFNLFSTPNNELNEIKSIKFNDFIVCVKK
jgi:transposase InsO family protein